MLRFTAALAFFSIAVSAPAWSQRPPDDRPSIFTLSGEGEVRAQPDIATTSFAVVTEARSASETFARQRARAVAVVAAIREAGIEERDVVTSGISITPRVATSSQGVRRIEGYTATNDIVVTIRRIERTGELLDALVKAGVNDIEGISFDFTNREALLEEARRKAATDVRRKAELYAAALGTRIVRVRSLSESIVARPDAESGSFGAARSARPAAPTPVAAGELGIKVFVSATFDIEPQ